MPLTARGIWYPDSTEHVRTWEHWQEMAESVDAAIDDAVADSGWVTATTDWTIAAGWTLVNVGYRKLGPIATMHFSATRTGATLTGSATGNVTDTDIFSAIPTLIRPHALGFRTVCTVKEAAVGAFVIPPAGNVELEALHVGATIASGDNVIGDATYFVA